jgi:hypothetical protein
MKYGVDAVISGHDELWERSAVSGLEELPGDSARPHILQFYDVGVGGDGLRGIAEGAKNPYRQFVADLDAPEIWENNILVNGGKHYGHLEVNIDQQQPGVWQATLSPVYVFPAFNPNDSTYSRFERRIYDDEITLTAKTSEVVTSENPIYLENQFIAYPNPFSSIVTIQVFTDLPEKISLDIINMQGKTIQSFTDQSAQEGWHKFSWASPDPDGNTIVSGTYILKATSSGHTYYRKVIFQPSR